MRTRTQARNTQTPRRAPRHVTGMHADKSPWMYATLPNVEPTYKIPSETTLTIVEVANQDTLAIATVSAATQQASKALPKERKAA